MVRTYVRTYTCTSVLIMLCHNCNFLIGKGHTWNHVCFGRIHGSQLREGANAGQHTPTLSLPPSHHCLDGEVYRGNRHYSVCVHVYVPGSCVPWVCPIPWYYTCTIWYYYEYQGRLPVGERTRYVWYMCSTYVRTYVRTYVLMLCHNFLPYVYCTYTCFVRSYTVYVRTYHWYVTYVHVHVPMYK
jgi:hypothetical protein